METEAVSAVVGSPTDEDSRNGISPITMLDVDGIGKTTLFSDATKVSHRRDQGSHRPFVMPAAVR